MRKILRLLIIFGLMFLLIATAVAIFPPIEIVRASPDTESLAPDAYVTQTNLDGTISDIADDPDSPDGNWADAIDDGLDIVAHVSFPTPSGDLTTGANLQEFRIYVRRSTGLSTPTVYIDLYEEGVYKDHTSLTATSVTSDSGQMFNGTWDASSLGNINGSAVEAYIYGTKSGVAESTEWTSPTGFVDGGGTWTDEEYAYDENTGSYAWEDISGAGWGNWIELTHSGVSCDWVRVWSDRESVKIDEIEVEVYYLSDWHQIYSGELVVGSYQEYDIGSVQSVTAMRVRYYESQAGKTYMAYLCEADFGLYSASTYSSVDVGAVEWNVDYTPAAAVSITNTPDNCGFGGLAASETNSTGLTYFNVTNDGGSAVDITINGTDMTGDSVTWTLSDTGTVGDGVYALKAGLEGGSYDIVVKKTPSFNTLVSNLGVGNSQLWGLQIQAPSASVGNAAMTGTVVLTATEHV